MIGEESVMTVGEGGDDRRVESVISGGGGSADRDRKQ